MQLAIDSTSLGEFKTCPRRYYYSILRGLGPRGGNVHLQFGIWMHTSREKYESLRAQGAEHDAALDSVLDWALRETWNEELGRPWISGHDLKTRQSLIQTIVWYLDAFGRDDTFETLILANGRPAVELSFRFDSGLRTRDGEPILLCGHIDRIAKLNDVPYILDIKTASAAPDQKWASQFTPGNQFSIYTLAGRTAFGVEVRDLIVDGTQIGVGFSRFGRHLIPRTDAALEEFLDSSATHIAHMEEAAAAQAWPMNEMACLSGSTTVKVTRGARKGWEVSISKLFDMLNGKAGPRFDKTLATFLLSDVGGRVDQQKVLGVFKTGVKTVFELKTKTGQTIRATADHQFNTPEGWKKLEELNIGSKLWFWRGSNKLPKGQEIVSQTRASIAGLKYYPRGHRPDSKSQGVRNRDAPGAVQRVSILTIEAAMNGLPLEQFVSILKTDERRSATFNFLLAGFEVHHKDENETNDSLENLEVLTPDQHRALHARNTTRLSVTEVESIISCGEETVYDISMEGPHHNFIANDLVAHNCSNYGGCPFRGLCARSPTSREKWISQEYENRTWDPLRVRGDI